MNLDFARGVSAWHYQTAWTGYYPATTSHSGQGSGTLPISDFSSIWQEAVWNPRKCNLFRGMESWECWQYQIFWVWLDIPPEDFFLKERDATISLFWSILLQSYLICFFNLRLQQLLPLTEQKITANTHYNQCNTNMGEKKTYLPQFHLRSWQELTAKGIEIKIFNLQQTDTLSPLPPHAKWEHWYLHLKRKMAKQKYQNYRADSKNVNNIFQSGAGHIKQGVWSQTIIFTFSKGLFKFILS